MKFSPRILATIVTVAIAIPLGTIYRQNIEKAAERAGADQLLAEGILAMGNPYGLILLLAFFFSLGATAAFWFEPWRRKHFPRKLHSKLERIEGETFRHDRVVIDGRQFHGCRFEGVTLVFEGKGAYGFVDCSFDGRLSMDLVPEEAKGVMGLIRLAQMLSLPIWDTPERSDDETSA